MFRDRPLIPLLVLLGLLVILFVLAPEHRQPRLGRRDRSARRSRSRSSPAARRSTMLTGGIDLSVGAVASMAGFVAATLVADQGLPAAILVALVAAALAGLINGIGVGVFRVHPLIMTLGMGLVVLGLANVWQLSDGPDRGRRAARAPLARLRAVR